jgi:prevent-host-death family protein
MTKTMNALECKEKFHSVVDEVAESGETVVVMGNGRPVARIQPYTPDSKIRQPPRKALAKGQ